MICCALSWCLLCCLAAGKMPVRYNTKLLPSYARLVNFTERVWDYESCVEAQLKIWLARHLLAKTNSGRVGIPAITDTPSEHCHCAERVYAA